MHRLTEVGDHGRFARGDIRKRQQENDDGDVDQDRTNAGAQNPARPEGLAPFAEQIQLGQQVAARGLSVREAEALVERALRPTRPSERSHPNKDRDLTRLQDELSDALATTVTIRAAAKGKGQIRIAFASLDQLQGLIERLRA